MEILFFKKQRERASASTEELLLLHTGRVPYTSHRPFWEEHSLITSMGLQHSNVLCAVELNLFRPPLFSSCSFCWKLTYRRLEIHFAEQLLFATINSMERRTFDGKATFYSVLFLEILSINTSCRGPLFCVIPFFAQDTKQLSLGGIQKGRPRSGGRGGQDKVKQPL